MSFPQSQPLVKDCQFGVLPVNYSDSEVNEASVTSIATLPVSGTTDNRKKRKLDSTTTQTIGEDKIAKCNVSKKRKIQLALTERHINYRKRLEFLRSIPKSIRINSTIQVPSIYSTLQFKWEEAVLGLGTMPTLILLENWVNQQKYTILRYLDDIMIWSKQWSCRSRGDLKLIHKTMINFLIHLFHILTLFMTQNLMFCPSSHPLLQ